MSSVSETIKKLIAGVDRKSKVAFLTAFFAGLLTHMPVMLSDIPNHDGLLYLYDSQNVVTSGRWFLAAACSISSYFTIPWVIGILGMLYLGVAAGMLVQVLELKSTTTSILCSLLLVTFPALASTFAYAFAMDGYMLSLLLSVASVYFTKKSKYGWMIGLICLAFSMGIYQSYLPFAILLSIYQLVLLGLGEGSVKEKLQKVLHLAYMGALGGALYFVLLKILLALQGKVLDTYQGIDTIGGGLQLKELPGGILRVYKDAVSFTLSARVLMPNALAMVAMGVMLVMAILLLAGLVLKKGLYRSPWFYGVLLIVCAGMPLSLGIIYLISPGLNFHLLMRYQWVLLPMFLLGLADFLLQEKELELEEKLELEQSNGTVAPGKMKMVLNTSLPWLVAISGFLLVFCYFLVDNIGYSNLEKKYEKTYAYCNRLLDRMESTEGYYQGIPVAIMGVVGDDNYPVTDLTASVTGSLTGLTGDYLLYKAGDYQRFMSTYLGATISIVSEEEEAAIYYSPEYIAMESFPGNTSVQIIDGVLCVKTEDALRD